MTDQPEFDFDIASALAQGTRSRQEDAVAVSFPFGARDGFAILSDGMGGHAAGDLASRAIVSEVFAALTMQESARQAAPSDALRGAVEKANTGLKACLAARPDHEGMGGTVVATYLAGRDLHWVSVGDSVLYLFRDEKLSRLNADHSMAPQLDLMAANGAMTKAEAAAHPQRNCLTSALTGETLTEIDCPDAPLELRADDILVLASDGLQYLPDPIIEALLLRARNEPSRIIANDLLEALATLNDPDQDNTSLVVIRPMLRKCVTRNSGLFQAPSAMLKAMRRAVTPSISIEPRG
ncbi:PP2C family serine/threonine-protein phosphatase [Gymnodinialimonas hymeniacidonis]|uniref:PP2C family protein-serine/threonine phosphatase n=1 Tax=Gymnodinialimonas hymeniacidonis TaxID=3126508 RepID=UPI0034C67437